MKRLLAPVALLALLLIIRVFLSSEGATPAMQPPLAGLDDVAALKAAFNLDAANTRVVLLLSPSCPYCLKGASEIERILEQHHEYPATVFVVWQPILPTDWGKPRSGALRRLSDSRVRQFWDADHRVARALEQSSRGRDLQPNCCFEKGVWWDVMAVFQPGTAWSEMLPEPLLLDGTVEEAAPAFESLLAKNAVPRQ